MIGEKNTMFTGQKRSQVFSRVLNPWTGYGILLLVVICLSITAVGAQGPTLEESDPTPGDEFILRHIKLPSQDIVDLLPSQDTYITSNKPSQNYGLQPDFWIGYDRDRAGGGIQRLYLHWTTSVVPQYSIINSAELWYFVTDVRPSSDSAMNVEARHAVGSWNENNLTWNNAPGANLEGVSSAGAIGGTKGWMMMDVTSLVREWTSGAHPNNGLVLVGDERVQDRQRGFRSANAAEIDQRPFLRLNYTESSDSIPPTASMVPFSNPIIAVDQFNVSWTGADNPGGTGIAYYDVQVDSGGGQGWKNWLLHTTNTSATFTGPSAKYRFRVRAVDKAGNISPWSAAEEITVDVDPPVSQVLPFDPPIIATTTFQVEWRGDDGPNGSGIASYNVYYRFGNGSWTLWQSATTDTSAEFNATIDAIYAFEATAVDNLGNAEPRKGVSEASVIVDIDPPFVDLPLHLPVISTSS